MEMRIRFFFLLFIFCVFSATAASAADQRIIVGIHENTPLIFTDSDSQVKGIAVDLLIHIARKESWEIQYLPGSYAQCTQRLETGAIDLLGCLIFRYP
ncbi:MAG: transporter substrate-binding domain-containing protein [Desulfosarcina sp.]|nr:transporter substrate-binding domain-containing protein [Desulfosarcina sp.]